MEIRHRWIEVPNSSSALKEIFIYQKTKIQTSAVIIK